MTCLKVTYFLILCLQTIQQLLLPVAILKLLGILLIKSYKSWDPGLGQMSLQLIPVRQKLWYFRIKKNTPPFNFVFNNNDLDKPNDPALISSLERITNSSKVPAIKMLGVYT